MHYWWEPHKTKDCIPVMVYVPCDPYHYRFHNRWSHEYNRFVI